MEWLKCEFMLDKVGQTFEGIITGVTGSLPVELRGVRGGAIYVTSLRNDYYRLIPSVTACRENAPGKPIDWAMGCGCG